MFNLFGTTIPTTPRRMASTGFAAHCPRIERPVRRERDFGIGYGNSSGYASRKRYIRDVGTPRFRVA